MPKKKGCKSKKERISQPIIVQFTETTLKKVVSVVNTTKMCYDDDMPLSDTRAIDIILNALMSGETGVIVDFDK